MAGPKESAHMALHTGGRSSADNGSTPLGASLGEGNLSAECPLQRIGMIRNLPNKKLDSQICLYSNIFLYHTTRPKADKSEGGGRGVERKRLSGRNYAEEDREIFHWKNSKENRTFFNNENKMIYGFYRRICARGSVAPHN